LHGLVNVLLEKKLITSDEFDDAVAKLRPQRTPVAATEPEVPDIPPTTSGVDLLAKLTGLAADLEKRLKEIPKKE